MNNKQLICTYGTKLYNNNKQNVIIVLYIIDTCNYNCYYCGNKFPRIKYKLNLIKIYNYLRQILSIIDGNIYLDILGGEPTLHPQLNWFCEQISKHSRILASLYTNYSQDIDYYIKLFNQNINVIPSWHSIQSDRFNLNFINKIKQTIKILDNKIINLRIMYEDRFSKQSIEAFKQLYIEKNLNIEFSLLVNSLRTVVKYTNEQINEYQKFQEIVYHNNDDVIAKYSNNLEQRIGYYDIFKNKNITFKYWQCDAGKNELYIHCNGNVYPCPKFYTDNKQPLYNIYINDGIIFKHKPLICTFSNAYCECDKDIKKQRVIK